ncbi:MAG: bifunctional acetate--CoA ligase family protein/GNAT family N-acetyltransferase [Hyphomicrobium sp.]
MTIRNLDALLTPNSVVFIGASPTQGSVGYIIARNLLRAKFQGKISFINPKHEMVEGVACIKSISDLKEVPDLAVIATPAQTIPQIIRDLAAKGTRAAVIISAGLSPQQKTDVLNAARSTCLRIQGSNCLGLMLPLLGLDASFSQQAPLRGDLAFLSQSGALITTIVDWAAARNIGFSHVVSLGDMLDVDFGDLLDYFATETTSRAILLYIEAITQAPKFLTAARRAARTKPVIVIKAGRQEAGARAALSHTGALAGSDAAYEAAFRRAGVLRVLTIEELFDAAETLSRIKSLDGDQLTILTNGGGAGVLAVDRLSDWSGSLSALPSETLSKLNEFLPSHWSHANPIDIIGDATPERYRRTVEVLLSNPTTNALLIINCPTALADSTHAAETIIQTIKTENSKRKLPPVLTVWLGDGAAAEGRSAFHHAGVPTYESPEDAIDGFMQIVRYRRAQEQLMSTPPSLPEDFKYDNEKVKRILTDNLLHKRYLLSEIHAKDLLGSYGIPTVPTRIARTPQDVGILSAELLKSASSIVLKILSKDISHKSDVGGVHLDLQSSTAAIEAAEQMLKIVAQHKPDAKIEGFTVQEMIHRNNAHELLAGVSVDPTFGPLLLFGAGGTAVEVIKDTALALPPLDLGLAHDLIRQPRIYKLLSGYRDRPPADLNSIALALVRLSYLVSEHPEIRELDINPLLANDKGVVALDSRVVIADPLLNPRTPMCVRPYPSQWIKDFLLQGSRPLVLRPIRPDDEHRYKKFINHVTPDDMRMRFFTPAKSLTHAAIARLTQIDYKREMAFVAIDKATGALLGVARMMADPDYQSGEFAILVASDLKGQGLGRTLMQQLISYATEEGLQSLSGFVLAENYNMLDFVKHLGFSITLDPQDAALRRVTLELRKQKK